ncbi:MAG: tRNA 2-thiouridine(34) synthase MnmA [Clostridia bacterium]|nr:tRNA 2-thiouridine(34) synthase MnmA [Clostridia bacterium]
MMAKVMIGMSGGVDSSAAALVLQRQGYDLCGVTLLLTPDASEDSREVADAKAVCASLGIEHICCDLREQFSRDVMRHFCGQYSIGKTPNPCIECNRCIKFGAMLDIADEHGCDFIATGHYARVERVGERYELHKSHSSKDQSYVLWTLTQSRLSRLLLPLCDMEKEELRAMVREAGLPVYQKPDSQDICFIPDGDYARFLREYAAIDPPEGDFLDRDGRVIGKHKGITNYTIGQRKGLGGGFSQPMYVVELRPERNEIVLGGEGSQYSSEMTCDSVNLISPPESDVFRAQVKVRYSARPAQTEVRLLGANRAEVVFDTPQRAVTPGQSAVFYDGDRVIGGAVIDTVQR